MRRGLQLAWRLGLLIALLFLLVTAGANAYLLISGKDLHRQLTTLDPADVALVLGTSHFSSGGEPNAHFLGRMNAAAALYHAGRVRHLLASGANPEIYYNEPQRMLEALRERGVPAADITLDYGGRRTLDSVVRARAIFGQQEVIIVSQPYHLYRALFLARAHDLRAQGYAAPAPALRERWNTELREVFARLLAVMDVHVLGTRPQVLGEPEPIRLPPSSGLNSPRS